MLRRTLIPALALAVVTLAPAPRLLAQDSAPWIHVRVEQDGESGSKVSVNLPLSVAQIALSMAPTDMIADGKIRMDQHDVKIADVRRMWAELRNAGDGEFVTVEGEDENVSVSRRGDRILILVSKEDKGENVRVDVPVSLVDALLSSEGDELNLIAAVNVLAKERGNDIITVQDGADKVRIWVDTKRS